MSSKLKLSRRHFLGLTGLCLGGHFFRSNFPLQKIPWFHSRPKARSFVFLTMYGGPSQLETFDYKPELIRSHGKSIDFMTTEYGQKGGEILRPRFSFKQYGQSGAWVSEIFPHLSKWVDELCFLKSCTATSKNHGVTLFEMNTGHTTSGHPTLGSWISHALARQNSDLPDFFVFVDSRGHPHNGELNWAHGQLPSRTQAIPVGPVTVPIPYLDGQDEAFDQAMVNFLADLDGPASALPFKERLESMKLALSMQKKAKEIFSLKDESEHTKELYGINHPQTQEFGTQLLYTRKLLEHGVPVIQLYHGGNHNTLNWDQHQDMILHRDRAQETDRPIAGFLADLKMRGLLDEVVLLWGGEFGKLAVADLRPEFGGITNKLGRQHNEKGFTMWMAGAGIKKGHSFGQTDELGYEVVQDPVTHLDIQATVLHLMGIDYRSLKHENAQGTHLFSTKSRQVITSILS